MHSRIFQISTEPIDKENYLNEDTLQQGDGSFYDYCSEIDEENRKEDIANLVNYALPNGMVELISDGKSSVSCPLKPSDSAPLC